MTAPVQASRLTLVIGNNDYIYSQPLNSPVNDAKDNVFNGYVLFFSMRRLLSHYLYFRLCPHYSVLTDHFPSSIPYLQHGNIYHHASPQ